MNHKKLVIWFLLFISSSIYAQNIDQSLADLMEEAHRAMQERFQMMEKLQQEMLGGSLGGGSAFSSTSMAYQWQPTDEGAVFEFRFDPKKEMEFNITVEGNSIRIEQNSAKGNDNNNSNFYSYSSSSRVISIPTELDAEKPRFEKVDGKIKIYFKKKKGNQDGVI